MPNQSDDPITSFRTHSAYATAYSYLATGSCPLNVSVDRALNNTAGLIQGWATAPDTPATGPVDLDAVHRSLRHAWGTELLQARNLEMSDDGLVRLANTWSIVQSYYVLYHSTQALWVALGNERPTAHPKTQNLFIDLWVTRTLHLPPLTLGVGPNGPHNVPAGTPMSQVHQWSNCSGATCWPIAALSLTTTRNDVIEARKKRKRDEKTAERAKDWDKKEAARIAKGKTPRVRPKFKTSQLTDAETTKAETIRSYGLIDYLYRLRIRANYVDASTFTDGPENDHESTALAVHLGVLSAVTLMGHEHRIGTLVGSPQLTQWMDDFTSSHPVPPTSSIMQRRSMYPL